MADKNPDPGAPKVFRGKMWIIMVIITCVMALDLAICVVILGDILVPCGGAGCLNPFQKLALCTVIFWMGVLLGYYLWAIFFYNVNFGYTDYDWEHILSLKRANLAKREFAPDTAVAVVDEPDGNPHAGETLGLPPGTVRGTIALTLLVGGMAMLLLVIGQGEIDLSKFEFFTKAFLMMIAFYFGTKGLEILNKKPETAPAAPTTPSAPPATPNSVPSSPAASPFAAAPAAASPFAAPAATSPFAAAPAPAVASPFAAAPAVPASRPASLQNVSFVPDADPVVLVSNPDRPNEVGRQLARSDIEARAQELGVEPCVLGAVIRVESGNKGFLADGRPKILFEGHVFWRELEQAGKKPETLAPDHPDILFPHWTKEFYRGGAAEYERLARAKLIDETCALRSASWGMFQILGTNHKAAGFDTVQAFVAAHQVSEREHLQAFCTFIRSQGMVDSLIARDWAAFAKKYNGSGYRANEYDTKLKAAYEACVKLGVFTSKPGLSA